MQRVENKVCIVTGAGSGMGKVHAKVLAAEGAKLVLTDVNEQAVKVVAASLGDCAIAVKHNVAEKGDWQNVIDAALKHFKRIDVLVNNAGILRIVEFVDTTVEDWDLMHQVNSRGTFLGCQMVLPIMEKQGAGAIINVSSIAAVQGMPITIAYGASKGSVMALTKGIAVLCREKKNGVRCNSIHPDGVKTPMITGNALATAEEIEAVANMTENAAARMCDPEDISAVVLFLASDESRFVNGLEFMIDNAASITPPPAF